MSENRIFENSAKKLQIVIAFSLVAIVMTLFSSSALSQEFWVSPKKQSALGKGAKECAYVGVKKCAFCHIRLDDSVTTWAITKHANAIAALRTPEARKYSDNPEQDTKCLKCHVTGMTTDRIRAKEGQDLVVADEFLGVQCEMCHGPGAMYKKTMARVLVASEELDEEDCSRKGLVIPTEETCRKCHNEECPVFDGFDFEKAIQLIKHGVKENKCEYIGQEKCIFCHTKVGKADATGIILKHINAFSVLKTKLAEKYSDDPIHDEKCLECHTTGFNLPGGYAMDDPANQRLEGVQCEMCHGWGYSYVETMVQAEVLHEEDARDECELQGLVVPGEEVCVRCHNERCPVYTGFDFEASMEQAKHGKTFTKH